MLLYHVCYKNAIFICQVNNTKGSIGDISEDLKAVIRYLDSSVASTEYTKALDAEVESVKSDEKVRLLYMLLVEAYARERSMGRYVTLVSQIRDTIGELTSKQMARYFKASMPKPAAYISVRMRSAVSVGSMSDHRFRYTYVRK